MEMVPMCSKEKNGCTFGSDKCWFIHDANIEKAFDNAKKNNRKVNSKSENDKNNITEQLSNTKNV